MNTGDTLRGLRRLAMMHRLAYESPDNEFERRTTRLNEDTALAIDTLADELEDMWERRPAYESPTDIT